MALRLFILLSLLSATALGMEKPTIKYKAPPPSEDDRPLITEVVISPQGSDYALKLDFNRTPWGESCKNRCANATIFVDTDDNKDTGLKLADPKAPESGADLAITVQGVREYKQTGPRDALKVKVKQFAEDSTSADQGSSLTELDSVRDEERLLAQDSSVYILVDSNLGNLPSGKKMRVVYHPPDAKPIVGTAKGLLSPTGGRVELFKDGKLTNPVKKKKKKAY